MYWVKWKMTILFLTYREKCYIYIYIHNLKKIYFQLNSVMTCYVCVYLIKFIYIFICICFVSNKVLLKVNILEWTREKPIMRICSTKLLQSMW